ncbi:hypothetical protein [Butyrivibrio sp. MC2021]|uniref:hypothetical protein n=1 Tax=Butyrivibrio sp. MC2021 TaxID=1408306 RepID=UPI000B151D18|nr:hypothetical protein [Butyrivibrio sp. MC2021]
MGLFGKKPRDEREEIKGKIEKLMSEYDKEEIDGDTYLRRMMDLTLSNSKKKKK